MVKFEIPARESPNIKNYHPDDLKIAYKFSSDIQKELGNFLRGVILFGSAARKTRGSAGDIDVLLVLDDLAISMTREVVEAYRVIVQKIIGSISKRIHVTSLRYTTFWEYVRGGDPVAVNILRDGVALIDTGFFNPLQALLKRGRIRPTPESIWTYFIRAPNTLHNSKWHILQATLDLYWAVIDSSHAALMKIGEIPPTPDHVADLLQAKLVSKRLLEKKYVNTMRSFYKLMKLITHREIKEIKGEEFDQYHKQATDYVNRMKKIVEGKL
ncbi:nucleotidyltransferase domain-containing protein [Candidatus Woesearchaeota archaeon]|nr:nucleotidyltransferase domain-containing protein [Candidatus Woesearchaeota archaeon]